MTTSAPYYGDSAVMRTPPPDLPSLLLKERIVYLGLPLFSDDDAKPLIGQRKPVVVTGALQTPTGRMVFARLGTGTSAAGSKVKSKGKPSRPNSPRTEGPR